MLTWKNNTPLFSMNGDLGDALIMYFGEVMFDGFTFSEFHCQILLVEHNDTWSEKVKLNRLLYEGNKEPDVDMFVSELQSALQAHLDFDFSKYWSDWKKADPYFQAFVRDSSKHTWLA
jgi:hypothetical protein